MTDYFGIIFKMILCSSSLNPIIDKKSASYDKKKPHLKKKKIISRRSDTFFNFRVLIKESPHFFIFRHSLLGEKKGARSDWMCLGEPICARGSTSWLSRFQIAQIYVWSQLQTGVDLPTLSNAFLGISMLCVSLQTSWRDIFCILWVECWTPNCLMVRFSQYWLKDSTVF